MNSTQLDGNRSADIVSAQIQARTPIMPKMIPLQVDPENPRHVYIATEHSGLFITDNGGTDWQRAKPNVPRLTTTSLLALPGTILAGTVPAALYSASNG